MPTTSHPNEAAFAASPILVYDRAYDEAGNRVSMLRDALRAESQPLKRLPLIEAILAAFAGAGGDVELTGPRARMASLYEYDQHRKPAQRKRENEAAMALLAQIDAGHVNPDRLTAMQKATLAKYSGTGGGLIGADGKKGSAYEYYTPLPVAEGIWSALKELGFSGGKVLDPCGGSGIFGAAAPDTAAVDAVELNDTSGRINKLVNGGPGYQVTVSPFEKVAAATPDDVYDAVVSNVPFGDNKARGGNQAFDKKYQDEPLENYFILRSLDKLKDGGLAAFITPPRCVTGKDKKQADLRYKASLKAEFLGAFRLPNSVFGTAAADTMTDVIFLRKYSRDVREKIEELLSQSPQALTDSMVLWDEYLNGLYFQGEGKRFVLGEFKPKDPNKFRDVDRVISNASMGEIGSMLRKLPGSRVKWDLLNATETQPIVYNDGDTITQAGQTLQMQEGRWMPVEGEPDATLEAAAALASVNTPYDAFENDVSYTAGMARYNFMRNNGEALDIPAWLSSMVDNLDKQPTDKRDALWQAGVVGLSAEQVMMERGVGIDYQSEYVALSSAMAANLSMASKTSGASGLLKLGLATIKLHYSKKSGFSAVWRGNVNAEVAPTVEVTAEAGFEGLRYTMRSKYVPLDKAREVLGADFDPLTSDDYCISADGQSITTCDDYYSGNYGDFLRDLDKQIASASSEAIRAKLLRQKTLADGRVDRLDVSSIEFNLFSPHVTAEEKAEFLRLFVHEGATVVYDETTGVARPDIEIRGSNLNDRDKLFKRVGDYLKNGTITLGGSQLSMPQEQALQELSAMVRKANEQFNAWARANPHIQQRLMAQANSPDALRFTSVQDEAPLKIPGMNPALTLHGYQNAFVRAQSREFGGGNAFDVGLGKTFTSLASVQYAHSIGVKKKTAFVVPGSVLSNWRKEAKGAYANTDDCLFIGLREKKDGSFTVDSSAYDADLTAIKENRHAKIYMTYEAWERLRLRQDTIKDFGNHMRRVDASFAEVQDKKQDEGNKANLTDFMSVLTDKTGTAPYLEDLGIDSLVIDEAHAFKNASETSEFKSGKYLSLAPSAKRGLDMQAKAWYIRGTSVNQDGVLALTASPITNSPLEIYSMLSLAVGHQRVNDMMLGANGADAFMQMMCQMDTEEEETMDGIKKQARVFTGLDNVSVMRRALNSIYTIKNAEQVGAQIVMPDKAEVSHKVNLTSEINERLRTYKDAFRFAIDTISEASEIRGDEKAYEEVAAHFGEPMSLIAHPFNLINKMNMLIMDKELDERATYFSFSGNQKAAVLKAIEQFNKKKIKEDRRPGPHTTKDAVAEIKKIKDENGNISEKYKVYAQAKIAEDGRIRIDTTDADTQAKWDEIANKLGLDLDVSIPPKLAALLENIKAERAKPRGKTAQDKASPIVKQIIFCDVLAMHSKIKHALIKQAGIPAGAIAIITGKVNNTPEEILEVQAGFNANGPENKYQIVIANEKAEVGINLQIGTQAIHHLTIGWTPDSLQQRNGRGVRQGNHTGSVNVYFYDAAGTFDVSKRLVVGRKADWISQVMNSDGGNRVSIGGGMTNEQYAALIETVGDDDAMAKIQEQMAAEEAIRNAKNTRDRQKINIDTIEKQRAFIADNPDPVAMITRKVLSLRAMRIQQERLKARIDQPGKSSPNAIIRNQNLLVDLQVRIRSVVTALNQSLQTKSRDGSAMNVDIDQWLQKNGHNYKGALKDDDLIRVIKYGSESLTAKEGSDIHNEWEADVGLAKSMVAQSVKAYEEYAQQQGGMAAGAGAAFAEGRALLFNGEAVVDGALGKLNDGTLVIFDGRSRYCRYWLAEREYESGDELIGLYRSRGLRLVNPSEPGYELLLQEAARLEDSRAQADTPLTLYSSIAPDVSTRRTEAVLVKHGVSDTILPAPYFPIAISPSKAALGSVLARIAQEQSSFIQRFSKDGRYFITTKDAELGSGKVPLFIESVVSYAKAHDLELSLAEIEENSYYLNEAHRSVMRSIKDALKPQLDALYADHQFKTEQELFEAVRAILVKQAPYYPLRDIAADLASMKSFFSLTAGYSDFFLPLEAAIKAIQLRKPAASESESATGTAVQAEGQGDDDGSGIFVSLKGDTKPWKDLIKSYGRKDGGFKWDGVNEVWNIRRTAWQSLIKENPNIANVVFAYKLIGNKFPR